MSAAPSTFRKADVKRLLQATEAAGVKVRRVELYRDGNVSLVVGDGETNTDEKAGIVL
jgi:hypothetical protein